MAAEQPVLQFLPLSTSIAPSFWHALTSLKLHRLKLDDAPLELTGHYAKGRSVTDKTSGQTVGISGALELDEHSFQLDHVGASDAARTTATDRIRLKGTLRNFNTIEEFKQVDKARLLEELGDQIWHEMTSTASAPTHESLNPFLLITFADLKKYRYYYWCAFPALVQKPAWEVVEGWKEVDLSEQEKTFDEAVALLDEAGKAIPLEQVRTAWANDVPAQDPSSHLSALGWPVRNVLSYLSLSPSLSTPPIRTLRLIAKRPSVVGWEKNDKGKLGPRMADLAPLMDPTRLADQAVDLNLQLMRWRILPSLDLEKVKHTKCLLLGAGTLGCYVARTLMAWGVRKITLVDSSTVSFSNPVRQPLFEFADSLAGGKPKAATAAEALKRIYPGVDATGVELAIPMPGHPIPPTAVDSVRAQLDALEKLVNEHDVVYLLMDSRESRWLPTVMGAAKGKLVMNVALGFDTFLAMRHGLPPSDSAASRPVSTPAVPGAPYRGQLGCYYCNDIVAPMDSLSDRTLDQMCTVTRPGIASIASSTAVELMVSVLQHPLGARAPSDIAPPGDEPRGDGDKAVASPLGIVPHQIRGFLARFENLKITGQAYDRCTGCSQAILSAYRTDAFDLVQRACEDAKYLERLTGLDKLEEETEKMLTEGVEWDDDEEEAGENEDEF
ncbi:hypothetical protein Rhopal_005663-T1 [Rhodotorula paludigena]|uniref:Ubiquitin-like modifier-activating enzyme ATG7 n=1 Tax=Rhodotorula paludigena TaxID=86838 RepID=A0AAV5GR14_9BASI|nr:hypothetical protein Rhopal_005663-T1 [Rhodotorula paludigena]